MLHVQLKPNKKLGNKIIGTQGELIAAHYLKLHGFTIIEMNHWRKWGEIDIIARKNGKTHFVEVKTVSYETKADLEAAVLRGTWRPEENVHRHKLIKLGRVVQTWLVEHSWHGDWQVDVAAVRSVPRETYASIKIIPNIILD